MLSESQERMLLVAEKGREREVLDVFKKWGLDAVVVGEVTDGGLLRVKDRGKLAAEIPAHPLAEEGPVYRPADCAGRRCAKKRRPDWFRFFRRRYRSRVLNFATLLGSPAIASKRWITEQYDTSVTHQHSRWTRREAMPRSSASRTGDGCCEACPGACDRWQ